jgi:hypothetical protein
MRIAHLATAFTLALLVGGATAAQAAKGGSLAAGGNTIAGPGTTDLAAEAQETVFTDADAEVDICVTVVNTGKSEVTLDITGDTTPETVVPSGSTRAICVKNVSVVNLVCTGGSSCSTQWRVDEK